MKKTLRLLVTDKCLCNCLYCCNNDIKPDLFEGFYYHYEEIIITGGEPFLFPLKLIALIQKIKYDNYSARIYIYSSIVPVEYQQFINIMYMIDGLTFTIYNKKGLEDFILINNNLQYHNFHSHSLRLNIFADVVLRPMNLYNWNVKIITWQKDCPVPENEDFVRLPELW